ncbi:hypothetical protein PENANT_c030G07584 [Penicillium antarcticum]|uniref:Amidohydrolase-related domain-containing protein n=1 Tax=Penicillium antarcticum TaxID=416450 RepID=A0A1V6PVL0_9EURO|nr:uncharacterized protein N7508_001482 [Penicillium antarcticum]KAJ5316974.1 hypothetical protein N7508_001482 [Penicillium antarcticum]OQD80983.1 hypothetical protein PENANT_c030G07584 [Penicillium antarcticum]
MIATNTKLAYSSCKVILSHAGGTLPFLITRISTVSQESVATAKIYGKSSEGLMEDFRSFYFDLALSSSDAMLRLVLDKIPHSKLLYESDYPYASPDKTLVFKQTLDTFPMKDDPREKIHFKNAEALLAEEE